MSVKNATGDVVPLKDQIAARYPGATGAQRKAATLGYLFGAGGGWKGGDPGKRWAAADQWSGWQPPQPQTVRANAPAEPTKALPNAVNLFMPQAKGPQVNTNGTQPNPWQSMMPGGWF